MNSRRPKNPVILNDVQHREGSPREILRPRGAQNDANAVFQQPARKRLFAVTETWSEFFLYGFIFFTPLGHAGASVFFGFLALCFVIRKALHPDFSFLKQIEHLWLLLFFILCALSLVNSGPYLEKGLKALFFKWGGFMLVFLFVREALAEAARRRRVGWAVLIAAAIIGLDGLFQFLTGADLFYGRPIFELPPPFYQAMTAVFKNSNDLASYLVLGTSVALGFSVEATTRRSGWIFWLLTVLLSTCLLLTFSRGAWAGFFLGALLMALISRRWKALLPGLFLLAIPVLLHFSASGQVALDLSFGTGKQTSGLSGRSELWGMAMQLIRENPFLGKGIGTFMDYSGQRLLTMAANYAHNCYLQIAAESGIPSLVAFLLFLGTLFVKGIQAFRKNHDPLLLGLLGGLFAFSIHSAFDTQFYSVAQSFLFWSMLGLLAAASQGVSPEK